MIKPKLKAFKKFIRARIDAVLQGTHNHYLCRLPDRMDWISYTILRIFFSGIKVDAYQTEKLKKLYDKGIIVFASKYKHNFEFVFYHTRYKQLGLPYPDLGFDYRVLFWQPLSELLRIPLSMVDYLIFNMAFPSPYRSGYFKKQLSTGRVGFLSLIDEKGFYRRFVKARTDPIQHLIEFQQTTERPVFIVPQIIFFSKTADRAVPSLMDILFGPKGDPGKIRRAMALIINPKNVFVGVSDPLNLKEYLSAPDNQQMGIEALSRVLRRKLLIQINRHRQSITGPVLKSRPEIKEHILTSDRLQKFMRRYAKSRNLPRQQVHKEADGYIEEIAANYSTGFVQIASLAVSRLVKIMFEEVSINTEVLDRIKQMTRRGPLILLPCHKSHMDYLLLSYILYRNNLPVPHIAAGKNLSFWPMGTIFRAGGAFFIRRSFRGAMLYSRVFAEYIHKLLEEGFNIEFFLEGTRSRTGKLIMPKLGLLSILLNAFRNGACEDLVIVPIFVGYDRVLEEGAYLEEIEGAQKKPESLLQVLKARKLLRHRHGRIYVRFHEPISLNALLAKQGQRITDMTSKEQNTFCRSLAYRVLNTIDRMTVVTPHSLFASATLNCPKARFSFDQLKFHWETYISYLSANGAGLADTLSGDVTHTIRQLLEDHIQRKVIEKISEKKEEFDLDTWYKIVDGKRPALEYYRNNCISFFVPPGFTSAAVLVIDAFQFTKEDIKPRYRFLQDFFKNEFAYDMDHTVSEVIHANIDMFVKSGILLNHPTLPDTYNLTSAGLRKLKVYSGFLRAYFESYWIALNFFMRYPKNAVDPKDRLKKIQAIGNRMFKRNEIELQEALSKVNYDNAVAFFNSNGVKGMENIEKIEFYADEIQNYINCLAP